MKTSPFSKRERSEFLQIPLRHRGTPKRFVPFVRINRPVCLAIVLLVTLGALDAAPPDYTPLKGRYAGTVLLSVPGAGQFLAGRSSARIDENLGGANAHVQVVSQIPQGGMILTLSEDFVLVGKRAAYAVDLLGIIGYGTAGPRIKNDTARIRMQTVGIISGVDGQIRMDTSLSLRDGELIIVTTIPLPQGLLQIRHELKKKKGR